MTDRPERAADATARSDGRLLEVERIVSGYGPQEILHGVSLEVRTTEPGVQLYTGAMVNVPVPGLEGRTYGPFAGFCLETQIWPDSVNHPTFPKAVLRPGEILRQETDYVFSKR